MKNVIWENDVFYCNNIYYGHTDSAFIHKKHGSTLDERGFVGISPGLGKDNYGDAGIFYAWFLAPKRKFRLVINDYGVISRLNAVLRVIARNIG